MTEPTRLSPQMDRYQTLDIISETWTVWYYKVYNEKLARQEVLKVLKPRYSRNEDAVAAFFQSSKSLSKIQHTHVAKTYDMGTSGNGLAYATSEYVEGNTLSQMIASGHGFPHADVVRWMAQLAEALDALQRHNITGFHFDAADIVVTFEGKAILNEVHFLENERFELRSKPCMCPEREAQKQNQGCGIYSLGAVMYETLTGHLFDANATRKYPLYVPQSVKLAIEKCLDRNPQRRFNSGKAIITHLQETSPFIPRRSFSPMKYTQFAIPVVALLFGSLMYNNWSFEGAKSSQSNTMGIEMVSTADSLNDIHPAIKPLVDASTFSELMPRLEKSRDEGELVFGRENEFIRTEPCYIFVFGRTDESVASILMPGSNQRLDLLSDQLQPNVKDYLTNKAAVWVLPTR